MNRKWQLMIQGIGIAVMVTGVGLAQDGTQRGPADQVAIQKRGASDADQVARLQAQWQRATAALALAQNADDPDQARIAKLTQRVKALQIQLRKLSVDPQGDGPWARGQQGGGPGNCPFGFEPLGPGPYAGWGGGRGAYCPWANAASNAAPSDNQMSGQGRGPMGPGMGRGPGAGRGFGYGYGQGQGQGMGRGPGGGGAGWGWGRGNGGYGRGAGAGAGGGE